MFTNCPRHGGQYGAFVSKDLISYLDSGGRCPVTVHELVYESEGRPFLPRIVISSEFAQAHAVTTFGCIDWQDPINLPLGLETLVPEQLVPVWELCINDCFGPSQSIAAVVSAADTGGS
jgi:hypothetical protein